MSIYFYLNDTSRGVIKSDITLLSRECKIIYELKDLEDNATFVCTELCLSDSKFVSKLRLYQNLYGLDVIVLCYDLSKAELVADYARTFICDYSIVDMDMIRSAIYNESMDGSATSVKGIDDVLKRKRTTELEQSMGQLLEQEQAVNVKLREQIASLQDQCTIARDNAACVNSVLDKMMTYYHKVVAKSKELDSSLQQYKAILTEDVYERVNAFKYKDRPQVVYFKQYQYSLGMYELLSVLRNALYYQKHKSVKVIQLMDSTCSMRLKEVPDYYHTFINSYNRNDLYKNDFICCVGGYQQLLSVLLENMAKIDILIVFDTLSHEDIVMQNAMLQYGVCRTGEVARAFALGPNTLVNEGDEDGHFIKYVPLDVKGNTFVHNASSDIILRLLGDIDESSSTI